MNKHKLFLLNPGFHDGNEGPYFCPHNAAMEGLLKYVPELKDQLEIVYVDFVRPRPPIVETLGEENQDSPVLVLDEGTTPPDNARLSDETGRAFFLGEDEIFDFLHQHFGIMKPHE
ncbi:MAG: DUF3088 domain-containing protein [Candidatus Marinimicrobia bacterium]|nr:DUF3088 domain-containing protein [Candidatus Neomarinimicrobiota bacterium]MCF7903945.1 DUF3088 domain-containing protein [Candidatus Neomarinimicrobiota bacterium]